ncbi:MAG: glucose-6-phosphate isomerase [Pseudomonadales bacterium]
MSPETTRSWKALSRLANEESARDPVPRTLEAAGLLADLSKQRLSDRVLDALLALAMEMRLPAAIEAQFSGEVVNRTEQRAALHTALRAPDSARPAMARSAASVMEQVLALSDQVRQGIWRGYSGRAITDVVHIGIGGSHLGPELVVDALARPWHRGPRIHFVANIDASALNRAIAGLDPARTLFVIVSKSFSTLETRVNAESARDWFLERTGDPLAIERHFVAISTNLDAASAFGIPGQNVFPMWDWVGGRYSVWSPVGLPIALALGREGFLEFLAGGHAMDTHFRQAPFAENLPVLMALAGIWNYNFLGVTNQAILPYAERLRLLPDFLQQLIMESNGKSVRQDGTPLNVHSMPIVWGGRGTNGQHAFHQLLHQGTRSFAADFIVVASGEPPEHHQRWLNANALAQSQAMLQGQQDPDPHKQVAGGKPTTTLVLPALDPASLGALIALYEQVVFCQGIIWDINSFDQWGVELGKRLAVPIFEQLGGKSTLGQDVSTRALVDYLTRAGNKDL